MIIICQINRFALSNARKRRRPRVRNLWKNNLFNNYLFRSPVLSTFIFPHSIWCLLWCISAWKKLFVGNLMTFKNSYNIANHWTKYWISDAQCITNICKGSGSYNILLTCSKLENLMRKCTIFSGALCHIKWIVVSVCMQITVTNTLIWFPFIVQIVTCTSYLQSAQVIVWLKTLS